MNLRLAEAPFRSVQGEGSEIGRVAVFIRLSGCDYRCAWCDTKYASRSIRSEEWSVDRLIADVRDLLSPGGLVVLTGGNPLLQDCSALSAGLQSHGYRVAVETQGSVLPVPAWVTAVDVLTLSPKPPSSGNATPLDNLAEYVAKLLTLSRWCVKVVVSNDRADLDYAREVAKVCESLHGYCHVQPCNLPNDTADDMLLRLRELTAWVLAEPNASRYVVLPQLHRLMWGNRKGV